MTFEHTRAGSQPSEDCETASSISDEKKKHSIPDIPGLDEYVDIAGALKRLRCPRQIYIKLLKGFTKDPSVLRICGEIERGELGVAAKTAHSIKGLSSNLSLTSLSRAATLLESQLKEGHYSEESFQNYITASRKTEEFIEKLV